MVLRGRGGQQVEGWEWLAGLLRIERPVESLGLLAQDYRGKVKDAALESQGRGTPNRVLVHYVRATRPILPKSFAPQCSQTSTVRTFENLPHLLQTGMLDTLLAPAR
jgi:hypothetical protein